MGRSVLLPRRTSEATDQQLIASGAAGSFGVDPIDGDIGYRLAGSGGAREMPSWTLEKARAYSVAAYRTNPMGRAIIDTYVSFSVGDSGVSLQCPNRLVLDVANQFWNDPRNDLQRRQESLLRDHMLQGETLLEMLEALGMVRLSYIDPYRIADVELDRGNPLWHAAVHLRGGAGDDVVRKTVVTPDDITGLREGDVQFWPSWRALISDRRGTPFMMPVLDQLDNYDAVLSNLIDRTALARYLVWDVTVDGSKEDVDKFIRDRGGQAAPRSGTIEVHNKKVEWEPKTAQTGAFEDLQANQGVLTAVSSGVGLAKTWLSEPEGANRATSLTMAEPVRRRVGGVQNVWLAYQTDLVRYAVDRAVAAGRVPMLVPRSDAPEDAENLVAPSTLIQVHGPEIAASDAQVNATVMFNLAQGLEIMTRIGALSTESAQVAAEKGWETFVGRPWTPQYGRADLMSMSVDDIAQQIETALAGGGSGEEQLVEAIRASDQAAAQFARLQEQVERLRRGRRVRIERDDDGLAVAVVEEPAVDAPA